MYAYTTDVGQPGPRRWRTWKRWNRQELTPALRRWLLDEGSLTARLIDASGGDFRVRVLAQSWRRPFADEARALGMRHAERALVREVALECHGKPWVFARSIVPVATLRGDLRHLRRFGARSLGALLFATKGTVREVFEVARIAPEDSVLPEELRPAEATWARRSVFRLGDRALLVQEIFLPACRLG